MMDKLTKSEVIYKIKRDSYNFAWINTFSDLKLIKLDKSQDNWIEDLDDLIEAKFFDEDREMSIMEFEDEQKFSVVEFNDKDKEYVVERQILNKNKSPFQNENDKLVIRNYLDYDDQGQAYICYTKLCDVERGR
jgi:hypothetical protein